MFEANLGYVARSYLEQKKETFLNSKAYALKSAIFFENSVFDSDNRWEKMFYLLEWLPHHETEKGDFSSTEMVA